MNDKNYSGGGVLLFATHNDKVYLLLGKEKNGRFDDFGGSRDRGEKDPKITAFREYSEESCSVVGLKMEDLEFYNLSVYYFQYWVKIDYDESLPKKFLELRGRQNDKHYQEKLELKWIELSKIRKEIKGLRKNLTKFPVEIKIGEGTVIRRHLNKMFYHAEKMGLLEILESGDISSLIDHMK